MSTCCAADAAVLGAAARAGFGAGGLGKGRAAALQCCWRALNSLLYMAAATLSTKVVLNSRPGIGCSSPLCRCSAHGGCRCCAYLLHTVGSTQCAWTCHCSAAAVRLCGCVQLAMRLLRLCCRLQLQPQLGQMPLPAVLTQRQHRQLQVQLAMLAGEREGWGTSWSTYSNRTHWCATFSGVMSLHCFVTILPCTLQLHRFMSGWRRACDIAAG